jgi:hypothetical protein
MSDGTSPVPMRPTSKGNSVPFRLRSPIDALAATLCRLTHHAWIAVMGWLGASSLAWCTVCLLAFSRSTDGGVIELRKQRDTAVVLKRDGRPDAHPGANAWCGGDRRKN